MVNKIIGIPALFDKRDYPFIVALKRGGVYIFMGGAHTEYDALITARVIGGEVIRAV